MAKLLSYYRLCPLIDIKNLLGISEDNEKGVVLVTLGKNIVIKYRLSDQKQVDSWRSKEKFSSHVLFNKKQEKYVSVFNQSFIRLWINEDDNLDKVKKYKFNEQIHTILNHNNETFVVFKCGSIYPLNKILESRKTFLPKTIITEEAEIHDVVYTSVNEDLYFGFFVRRGEEVLFYWTTFSISTTNNFSKIVFRRSDAALRGYVLHPERNSVQLLTAWSDGKIYSETLKHSDKELVSLGELYTVIENLSSQHLIRILSLNDSYIAIYGSDPNEEGAVLLIYNTQFKVTQSIQLHKLYSNEANIWRTFSSILLPVGQNLVVVPFCLESEQLAALVGSHKPSDHKIDSDISFITDFEVANWETNGSDKNKKSIRNNKKNKRKISDILENKISEFLKQGQPEALILEQILPDIFEESNIDLLEEALKFFTDIPEKFVSKILKYVLSCDRTKFETKDQEKGDNFKNVPSDMLPHSRIKLIDKILTMSYSDILLLPYLRSELSIEQAVLLLKYLNYQLSEDGHNLPDLSAILTERYIINWACMVIDSNYQKFVLSKDKKIELVLLECKNTILEYLEALEGLKTVVPVLSRFEKEIKGKSYGSLGLANSLYSVEQISLY